MSIDKRIGAFSPIESKKIPIHEEFDETNSKHEKKRNLIQVKKAPRWKHIRGLRFFMHPFLDVYKAFGTSTDHQKPIYVSPGGRKKGHQQPLSQARKKCTHKSSYFSPNCKFEVFLINPRTITIVGTNHSKKPGEKIHCLGFQTTQKFEKKFISSKFPHMGQIFIFQNH